MTRKAGGSGAIVSVNTSVKKGQTRRPVASVEICAGRGIEGDAHAREAATIGLLEGLQNVAGHRGLDPDAFVPYFRPESARWWAELNGFWAGTLPHVGAGLKRES